MRGEDRIEHRLFRSFGRKTIIKESPGAATKVPDERRIGKGMITSWKRPLTVAAFAILLTMACTRSAFSAEAFSFPPPSFAFLSPTTEVSMGHAPYRVHSTPHRALLRH